jgi:carbon storage regulator
LVKLFQKLAESRGSASGGVRGGAPLERMIHMLVLSRKLEQGLKIGDTIEIRVLDVYATDQSGSRKSKVASIGIEAPREISILRRELYDAMQENREAEQSARDISGAALAGLLRRKRTLEEPK